MSVKGAQEKITQAVIAWAGTREIGHIHGDYMVDIPFPKKMRDEIVAAGRAQPHHILPETGWVSFYLRQDNDVEQAIALLHESYQIAQKQKSKTIEVENEQ